MTTIRKATFEDLASIMEIIADAQHFLRAEGVDQWQDGYPTQAIMAEDIEQGNLYVIEESNAAIVAIAAIIFDREPTYSTIHNGEWPNNAPYAVIHRMAIRKAARRSGLAKQLFRYAEQLCQERDIKNIRVDTHSENNAMQSLLQRLGYTYCGQITLQSGAPRIAYIKEF